MIEFKHYSDLLNLPYQAGTADCYGLVRVLYERVFGILLPNYARPDGFEDSDLELFARIIQNPDFVKKGTNPNFLNPGDVLAFRVEAPVTNHVGMYLGNNLFFHHLRGTNPREDNLDQRWLRRLTHVAHHKEVQMVKEKLDFSNFIPDSLKDQFL